MADPTVPALQNATEVPKFLPMHEQFVKRAKEGSIDLLFLGDSIIEGWTKAPQVWEKNYKPLNAANFGLGRRLDPACAVAHHQRRAGRDSSQGGGAADRNQ
jgi:hypothetical protein